MRNYKIILFVLIIIAAGRYTVSAQVKIISPDKKIVVTVSVADKGKITYSIHAGETEVLKPSTLGIIRTNSDFSTGLSLINASPVQKTEDHYTMIFAKRKLNTYKANKRVIHFKNSAGGLLDIVFQVSNDGVAFRYVLPGKTNTDETIVSELTGFHFPLSAKAWLQPKQVAKSGWEKTNPAYEEHYMQDIPVGTKAPNEAGWVYPALFRSNGLWALITEAAVDSNDCATRLKAESPDGEYFIGFPDAREVFTGRGLLPHNRLPYTSPWRIITIGSLATIIESALGTDLAKPSEIKTTSFIKPGKASWSWINSKDDFIIYDEQKKYIDFAADMKWQYCLVDADWDRKIGYDKIKELADYAKTKQVGLLLWYNSAGDWNTVKYTPRNLLLTHESRIKEFQRLKEMGIKGVKIDFFGGDGQSVMAYYIEILRDAAAYQLMVNFHGATLPRGWSRTYPNLLTTEAVRGFEMITFEQADADREANHCAMLPFTRNAFDPMDFTPMNLYKIPTRVIRKTTSAFELALSVLFLSGIQHYAESPAGMTHVPGYVQDFLRTLPDEWEDVKFIDGYPGKYVVLARRYQQKWYIAGINGENSARQIELDPALFGKKKATIISDGDAASLFSTTVVDVKKKQQLTLQPAGGFVMVVE